MKKILLPLMALAILLTGACNKESYYHTMSVVKPVQAGIVFADQEIDTLQFYTTDNFTLTSNADWAVVPDTMKSGKIKNYYHQVWVVTSPIVFDANTTGSPRTAQISIKCFGDDDWDNTGTATFHQISWLDITRPLPKYSYKERVVTGATFEAEDSATQVTDTLVFYVFNKWTLTDGDFVHPEVLSGNPGENKVALRVEQNASTTSRETSIMLTSRGVKTSIKYTQKGKKEEKDDKE